ncbi:MAG: cytochrome c oxidase subunit II [Sulfurimonas sp.]|nr:cytochrome c oxidase subunit II [Sulfurimonas sp.]
MLDGFGSNAATFVADIDNAFWINFWISIVLGLTVILPMIYFAWKYRESNVKDEDIENLTHNTRLEIAWTVIPTILLMVLFWYGYDTMKTLRTMPDASSSITIELEGKKWSWNYTYPANANGYVHKTAELYVPVDQNIILNMTAPIDDVLHAYYVPAFRMKEDIVPGRMTKQWFNSTVIGTYDVECAEYCGTNHAYMYSKIHVMPRADYDAWMNSDDSKPAAFATGASKGQELFENNGCASCHSVLNDSIVVGPSLLGITSTKDAQYLKDAIINPDKDIAEGFSAGIMGAVAMSDEDITELYAYIKTSAVSKGKDIVESNGCTGCHTIDGTPSAGPSFKGMGSLDAVYIKDAILNPNKDIAEGFAPIMPATEMSDEDISEVTKYFKAL